MAKGALTFNDAKDTLEGKGVDPDILDRLKDLFDQCEAGRYAGGTGLSDGASICEQSLRLAKVLEKQLR